MASLKQISALGAFAVVLGAVGVWFTVPPQNAEADRYASMTYSSPPHIPFGGRSTKAILCCDGCVLVFIGPPRGGTYMYCPGVTQLYSHYNIFPPAWQLGVAVGWRPCFAVPLCPFVGGGPVMLINGTSEQ